LGLGRLGWEWRPLAGLVMVGWGTSRLGGVPSGALDGSCSGLGCSDEALGGLLPRHAIALPPLTPPWTTKRVIGWHPASVVFETLTCVSSQTLLGVSGDRRLPPKACGGLETALPHYQPAALWWAHPPASSALLGPGETTSTCPLPTQCSTPLRSSKAGLAAARARRSRCGTR
jgi:hypothetical protein